MMLVLFVLRLLCLHRFPITLGELYPLCYCAGQYSTILAATELAFTYDEFAAFPIAWSSALVLRHFFHASPSTVHFDVRGLFVPGTQHWILVGLAGLMTVVGVQCVMGVLMSRAGFAFLQPIFVSASKEDAGGGFVVNTSSIHCAVEFPPDRRSFRKGENVHAEFTVKLGQRRPRILSFFVSGNQRSHPAEHTEHHVDWQKIPVKYSVEVGGREAAVGLIQDLATVRFVTLELGDEDEITVRLSLECVNDFEVDGIYCVPAVAVEYMF